MKGTFMMVTEIRLYSGRLLLRVASFTYSVYLKIDAFDWGGKLIDRTRDKSDKVLTIRVNKPSVISSLNSVSPLLLNNFYIKVLL